jgi:SAM-dependent methyltransferase
VEKVDYDDRQHLVYRQGRAVSNEAVGAWMQACVEPSAKMRKDAERFSAHPAVTCLAGDAERIPLPTDSCEVVLLFLVFHHVQDRQAAAAEIARVLLPNGMY